MNDKLFGDGKAVVVQDIDKGDEVGRQVGVRAVNFGRVCKRRRKEWGNEQQEEGDGLEEHFPLALIVVGGFVELGRLGIGMERVNLLVAVAARLLLWKKERGIMNVIWYLRKSYKYCKQR